MIYSLAAIAALGGLTAMSRARLEYCRQAADYSSAAALDETVSAVAELSSALKKLRYVTDDVLGRSICSKAYAEAMRAEAAMSVLPFSTQELEKLSGFLNLAGDYSASLLAQSEDELSEEPKDLSKLDELLKNDKIFGVNLFEVGLADLIKGYFAELSCGLGAVASTVKKYVNE